jgi:urease accessory protein UreF
VRCSGKYETINERYLNEESRKKSQNMGKSRLFFQGKLEENEIPNYVQREPSRPASSHKFRDVHKEKWMAGRGFINC